MSLPIWLFGVKLVVIVGFKFRYRKTPFQSGQKKMQNRKSYSQVFSSYFFQFEIRQHNKNKFCFHCGIKIATLQYLCNNKQSRQIKQDSRTKAKDSLVKNNMKNIHFIFILNKYVHTLLHPTAFLLISKYSNTDIMNKKSQIFVYHNDMIYSCGCMF